MLGAGEMSLPSGDLNPHLLVFSSCISSNEGKLDLQFLQRQEFNWNRKKEGADLCKWWPKCVCRCGEGM